MSHLSATSPSLFLTLMFILIVFFMVHVLLKTIDFSNCQLKHADERKSIFQKMVCTRYIFFYKRTTFFMHVCCPQTFFPQSSCKIATKSCKKNNFKCSFSCRWNIFILNILLSALKGCSPSSQRCYLSGLQLCACSMSPHTRHGPGDFSPLEVWTLTFGEMTLDPNRS